MVGFLFEMIQGLFCWDCRGLGRFKALGFQGLGHRGFMAVYGSFRTYQSTLILTIIQGLSRGALDYLPDAEDVEDS